MVSSGFPSCVVLAKGRSSDTKITDIYYVGPIISKCIIISFLQVSFFAHAMTMT